MKVKSERRNKVTYRWLNRLLASAVLFLTVESAIAKFNQHNFLEKVSTTTSSSLNSFAGLSNDPYGNGAAAQFAMQGLGEFLNLTGIPAAMNGDYTLAAINAATTLLPEAKIFNAIKGAGTGAESALNGALLKQQLSAQSAFNVSGGLSQQALNEAKIIFKPGALGNSGIPSGFGKYTTQTFNSPSGPFQVHFYKNPTTGEIWTGLDYKVIFNKPF